MSFIDLFNPVIAYVDPGSGSYIIQLLVAILLGGIFAIKAYWKKFVNFFNNKFSKSKSD